MHPPLPLDQMTLQEKLHVMETLWDDLCRHGEQAIPVPTWHKELLDERARLVREGKASFSDWPEAKRRIADRLS